MMERPSNIAFRVERIKEWLERNRARIESPPKGKLVFDWAGSDLVVRLELVEHIAKEKI